MVMGGEIDEGNRERVNDEVVMKKLGEKREKMIEEYVMEYMMIGIEKEILEIVEGGVEGWYVVVEIMKMKEILMKEVEMMKVVIEMVMKVGLGIEGKWSVIGKKNEKVMSRLWNFCNRKGRIWLNNCIEWGMSLNIKDVD